MPATAEATSILDVNQIAYLDEEFVEAEEPEGFSKVPDGDYKARIFSARADMDNTGNPRLNWELIIESGPCDNRHLFRRNVLRDGKAVGWLKKDLRNCGIDIDDPAFRLTEFLVNSTEQLLDLIVDITVKNGKYTNSNGDEKDSTNVYINGLVSGDIAEEEIQASPEPQRGRGRPNQQPAATSTARRTTSRSTTVGATRRAPAAADTTSDPNYNPFAEE
ncbi:MAG: DUF669 domain-containing protein [Armatimonadota bacterium]